MKTLIAGPWVGEFGWELFAWQAYIRSLSRKFDKTVIISRENSKAIYDDFADKFIAYDPSSGIPDSFFIPNFDIRACLKEITTQGKIPKEYLGKGTTLFLPRRIGFPPHTHYEQGVVFGKFMIKPEYISFGEKNKSKYDYIFHIRNRELRKEDNWSLKNWIKLRELLGEARVACIGTYKESATIPGVDDLRGVNLKSLMEIMKNSKYAFGSSSGPLHLAALCGLPHVVWSIPANKIRYEENWNPLKTQVLFDSTHQWHPSPEYVYEIFKEWSIENEVD